jgi:hypothetical protein
MRRRCTPIRSRTPTCARSLTPWLPLTYAISRSMGSSDLHPFVIAAPVQAKLGLVHRLVAGAQRTH